jgi:thioredoxin-related protein
MRIIRLALIQTTFFIVAFLSSNTLFAQTEPLPAVNWLTFKQVKLLNQEKPKPIMVYFYKASDDSSQLMLKTTFTRKEVCIYTNTKYYAVKLDISSKAEITFMDGKIYKRDPAKPYHDLAYLLLGEKPVFPTVLLYDDQNNGFSFNGYKNYYDLLCMLVYISENVQKTTKYEKWAPAYFHTFPPDKKVNRIPLAVNWLPLTEALKLNKANPKGIFLTFFTKSSAASSVMLANAFSHSKVADYLDGNFYCVRLDAQTTDTLIWDKEYSNKHEAGNYNELATTMLKGKMQFPAIFYFDINNRLILNESSYLTPEALYLLSNYVVSESYKSEPFAEFMKHFKFDFNDIVPREFESNEPSVKPE